MQLNFKKVGESGPNLIILHGVFGSLDNWLTISKTIADAGYTLYLVDQRNHGRSPHADEFSYDLMADDLNELIRNENITNPTLIGHSMGGKTVMRFVVKYPGIAQRIVVVDMTPKRSVVDNDRILAGLNAIDFTQITSRQDADAQFAQYVHSLAIRQFILKNLYRQDDGTFGLRINLPVLTRDMPKVGEVITSDSPIEIPALFMRGGNSDYVLDSDWPQISQMFPLAELDTIEGAGHWVQAEQPKAFTESLLRFLSK